jgi:hypothetical protein
MQQQQCLSCDKRKSHQDNKCEPTKKREDEFVDFTSGDDYIFPNKMFSFLNVITLLKLSFQLSAKMFNVIAILKFTNYLDRWSDSAIFLSFSNVWESIK